MPIKPPRLWPLVLISLGLLAAVAVVAPGNLPVVVYKLALVSVAGCAGYWLDRALFPHARPHMLLPPRTGSVDVQRDYTAVSVGDRRVEYGGALLGAAAMIRRAIVVAAAMIGVTMGL
ncbi:putative holin [Algiphilus sp.]|uniref:putative holin n=1 Tax=Algiphilus sp. TaxID=1872431 RepID=UPI0025BC6BC0|nr:putative holin [Algiphilus sp.]MCK5770925.1 putative holin [Algiphilus sp.]